MELFVKKALDPQINADERSNTSHTQRDRDSNRTAPLRLALRTATTFLAPMHELPSRHRAKHRSTTQLWYSFPGDEASRLEILDALHPRLSAFICGFKAV